METLRDRIASVFEVHLPINRGSGRSLYDPVVVKAEELGAHENIMQQWMHFKGVLEEQELSVWRTVPIIHHRRFLYRLDVACKASGFTAAESKTDHFYFDVTNCIHLLPYQPTAAADEEPVFLDPIFSTLDDYLDFYLDEEEIQRAGYNGECKATLRKCNDDRWAYWYECTTDGKTIGEYVAPFTPSPANLKKFHEGCLEIARRLNTFRKTNELQSVPVQPPAFQDLALEI